MTILHRISCLIGLHLRWRVPLEYRMGDNLAYGPILGWAVWCPKCGRITARLDVNAN